MQCWSLKSSGAEKDKLSVPVSYAVIQRHQGRDKSLLNVLQQDKFQLQAFHRGADEIDLICHNPKIVIPASLKGQVMEWYHLYLAHPGIHRTEETIGQHLWWKTCGKTSLRM